MCTTILLISTLVIMLRRHFSNRVEPHPGGVEETRQEAGPGTPTRDTRKGSGEVQYRWIILKPRLQVLVMSQPQLVWKQLSTSHQLW
ncbi:progressive rod-cone degeneration protein precursor [Alligator mississippiensis]|uniref:Progressive rod-cone degeneration protein n=1 Tax=Alligator mississippiensis TaxID=8496 RepID=A0A151N363_ALLMI|nr:progressive rod-cone degeneration protein precursor [Alligator mississippiensis]